MKKIVTIVLILACVMGLVGCGNIKENTTYSFHGEHEYFTITHGEIALGGKEEVFNGGVLESYLSDLFENAVSYSTTFYTLKNGEKHVILSNSVVDQTGTPIKVNVSLGTISGSNIITDAVEKIDDLGENLWFELKINDSNGEENAYQLQLIFSE